MNLNEIKKLLNQVYTTYVKTSRLELGKYEKFVDKCWDHYKKKVLSLISNDTMISYIRLEKYFISLGVENNLLFIESPTNDLVSVRNLNQLDNEYLNDKLELFIYVGISRFLQIIHQESCDKIKSDLLNNFDCRTSNSDDITYYSLIKYLCNKQRSKRGFNKYIDKKISELLRG